MSKKSTVVLPQTQQILNQMGEQIRLARLRRHLSAELVAERAGISNQHMGAIEAPNMTRAISMDVLFNLATVLEIEPYILLKCSPDK